MLGGDVLTISGPCFDQSSDVYCRMDDIVIKASYDFTRDAFSVRCPTPIFMKEGSITVELSKDGGSTFDYSGYTVASKFTCTRSMPTDYSNLNSTFANNLVPLQYCCRFIG